MKAGLRRKEKEQPEKQAESGVDPFVRAAIAKYHSLKGPPSRELFLTVRAAASPESGVGRLGFC